MKSTIVHSGIAISGRGSQNYDFCPRTEEYQQTKWTLEKSMCIDRRFRSKPRYMYHHGITWARGYNHRDPILAGIPALRGVTPQDNIWGNAGQVKITVSLACHTPTASSSAIELTTEKGR